MILRCPYCKEMFGPDPVSVCPRCGKGMTIPDRLLRRPFRERKKLKESIVREAATKRKADLPADLLFSRTPATVLFLLLLMLLTGAALLSRTGTDRAPSAAAFRAATAEKELQALRIALERCRADCGRYPTAQEGLRALAIDPGAPGWAGPYVTIVKPDPWHTPYQYGIAGDGIRLRSCGPDRRPGTLDDLLPEQPSDEGAVR